VPASRLPTSPCSTSRPGRYHPLTCCFPCGKPDIDEEPKTAKNRLHLDVSVDAAELDSEVERLCAAGATLTGYNEYPGHRAALMRDPEGNEFDLH
jgi:hypothetical protein